MTSIACGDYEDVQHWIGKARDMRSMGSDVFCASVEYELRVLLAFARMDSNDLPDFSLPHDVSEAFLRPVRSRQTQFALHAAALIVTAQRSLLEPLLSELDALHDKMRNRGYQDFPAAVLATGLLEVGRSSQATALLEEYLRDSRRELLPPPPYLLHIAQRLGVAG